VALAFGPSPLDRRKQSRRSHSARPVRTSMINSGLVNFTAVATPEPTAFSLMLTGIGLLALMWVIRKGTAQGLPRGS
jgi:hypothetical protein